jgi:hypothetical protein
MFKLSIIIFATLLSIPVLAGEFKSEAELKPFAESVMKQVAENNLKGAFKLMQPYVVISESELQSASLSSQTQREQYGTRYGKAVGYEFISEQKLGESLIGLVYIEKTEKHALPWSFCFYKTPKGWVLNTFNWNDKVTGLFNAK